MALSFLLNRRGPLNLSWFDRLHLSSDKPIWVHATEDAPGEHQRHYDAHHGPLPGLQVGLLPDLRAVWASELRLCVVPACGAGVVMLIHRYFPFPFGGNKVLQCLSCCG